MVSLRWPSWLAGGISLTRGHQLALSSAIGNIFVERSSFRKIVIPFYFYL